MLNQAENEMIELKRKRDEISRVLKTVVEQETRSCQNLDSLDRKIAEMSREAVSFENKFRNIKGDSILLGLDRPELENEDCLMVRI